MRSIGPLFFLFLVLLVQALASPEAVAASVRALHKKACRFVRAKKYGAAIIALPNDDKEIPEDPQRRLELTKYIVETATSKYGIPIEDIVIDPLAMPIGADSQMVVRTLETIELIADQVGVNMTLGASNVSFGMPDRHTLNSVFLPMAMGAGLTSAIMDARTEKIVTSVKAADLMMGNDEWGMNWISAHRAREAAKG